MVFLDITKFINDLLRYRIEIQVVTVKNNKNCPLVLCRIIPDNVENTKEIDERLAIIVLLVVNIYIAKMSIELINIVFLGGL